MKTDAGRKNGDSVQPGLTFRDYAKQVPDVVWIGDVPWRSVGGMLRPLSMPHVPIDVDRRQLRKAISEHGALLAYWTSDWDGFDSSEWWWTCCDGDDYDVAGIGSSRGRRSIRSGLRDCAVRRVEPDDFLASAYPIHRAAAESYGQDPPSESEYAETIERLSAYAGTEFWGAFVDERMAAFAMCQTVDDAVILGSTKSDRELDKHNPNAALFYALSQDYLQRGLKYVSNGSRTLLHPTAINEFLERLGFRKVPCRVNVELSRTARIIDRSRVAKWGGRVGIPRLAGGRWDKVAGFDELMRIADTFR